MPNNYTIQTPPNEKLDPRIQSRISNGLKKLGVPAQDWRYVVLPEQNWKDAVQAYGQTMPHHTDTAFSNLPGKVTYLRQSRLNRGDDDFMTTLAHEYGHRKLNSTKEEDADSYARQAIQQWRKYGRSNDGALSDAKAAVAHGESGIEPTRSQPPALLSSDSLLPHAHAAILGALGAASQTTVKQQ